MKNEFYCVKPSNIPCHSQCENCARFDAHPLPVQEQGGKILQWLDERITYLADEEREALSNIDGLPVGSPERRTSWDVIKELGWRKNELQELKKKIEQSTPPASQPSYVGGEEEPPMVIYFETCGDQMEIKCPDEDGEFAICVKNKGARHFQVYTFPVDEAKGIAEFLLKHAKNADDAEAPSTTPDKEDKPVPEVPKMDFELAARSDVAALEYSDKHGRETYSYYNNGSDLCEAHEAGQTWMYRHMQEEIAQVVENATAFSRLSVELTNEKNALESALSSIKAERDDILKEFLAAFSHIGGVKHEAKLAASNRAIDILNRK